MKIAYKVVNGITVYRILVAPLLLWLLFNFYYEWFKWMLAISFITDALDGYLARKFKVTSKLGSMLDSIGDDLTIGVAIIGMFKMYLDFHLYSLNIISKIYEISNRISDI